MRQLLYALKNDESLMLAYQHGDVSAFEVLYRRYKNNLFAFICRSCPENIAEELAQETWTAIIDNVERYQVTATFKTYLFQIAHNKVVDFWRRKKADSCDQDVEQLVDRGTAGLERQYNYTEVIDAIRGLPNEQRDAFLLREQGFSQDDIAKITGCGRETVKSRLRYAVQTLRQQFEVSL